MASSSQSIGPVSQQYAAAATVPLIKSPSLWMPKPVELPNDVHPLPDDITAYFVYPFNLETHVLSQHPQPHEAISQRRAKAAAVLHQREVEEEQKEKAAMQKKAPGYNPSSVLVPMSVTSPKPDPAVSAPSGGLEDLIIGQQQGQVVDPMDDLASQLESLNRGH